MDELSLSNDLNHIEIEINWHKENAGRSVWEIGRRLNHVKENDLAHGDFINWVENKLSINRRRANEMMKVAKELPNDRTLGHLGSTALYIISTLPDEKKEAEIQKAEEGNPSTVKELRKLKKQLKEKESQLEREQNKEPEVVEKIIEKEVIPDDYEEMKQKVKSTEAELESYRDHNKFLEESLQNLYDERSEVDEKSRKYDELNEAIKNAENKLDDNQRMISRYNKLVRMINEVDNVIMKTSGFVYTDISEIINQNDAALRDVQNLIYSLERLTDDLKNTLQQGQILEGEIINE